ncbi:MAG: GNAT family N-acetyltransferase [Paracoccaceae bacterium]
MTITIREATQDDAVRLEAFLKRRMETSMFLRSNLREFGIGNKTADYAMRYFLRESDGETQGVGAIANSGSLMMQAAEGLIEISEFMQSVLPDDTAYNFIIGESAQAVVMRKAFGLTNTATAMDDVEPLFALDLQKLVAPPNNGAILRNSVQQDIPLLIEWGYDYLIETGLRKAGASARETVEDDVARRVDSGKLRLLTIGDKPVAQTGFNAVHPYSVQIGGVYTPPENRRQGYGGLAVALHLQEVRAQGVQKAILFSANEYASRAYRGIGFEQIGHYTLTIFAPPETED